MSDNREPVPRVWNSFKRILDTLLASAENRVELFAVELQEEKCRLVEALICAAAATAFGLMPLTLVTFTIVILVWEDGRVVALTLLSALYLACAILAWRGLQKRLKNTTGFSATLGELRKDRACLPPEH